jgi:hypothetical protein
MTKCIDHSEHCRSRIWVIVTLDEQCRVLHQSQGAIGLRDSQSCQTQRWHIIVDTSQIKDETWTHSTLVMLVKICQRQGHLTLVLKIEELLQQLTFDGPRGPQQHLQ